jgi:hypothetical protein
MDNAKSTGPTEKIEPWIDTVIIERDNLRVTMQQVLADAKAQDVLVEWWPMMERALGHNA